MRNCFEVTLMNSNANHTDIRIEKDTRKRWMVVKTKPRCEKKISELCERCQIVCYLPLRRSVRRYKSKTATFMVPIFPGYVFAQIESEYKGTIVEFRHSAQVIIPEDAMEDLLIQELNDIQRIVCATCDGKLLVRPEIQMGKPVKITSGVLSGLYGIIVRRNHKTRVTVNVEMIGYSVTVEIDVGGIEIEH